MIERMKAVCIAAADSHKDELLVSLRDLGAVHLARKQAADPLLAERFSELSHTMRELKDYEERGGQKEEILPDAEFEALHLKTAAALRKKAECAGRLSDLLLEAERIRPWGEFDPREIGELPPQAELHLYQLDKKEYRALCREEGVRFIRLRPVGSMEAVAVIGSPPALRAAEFRLPEKGLVQLSEEMRQCREAIEACESTLRESARCMNSYAAQLLKAQNAAAYSAADASLGRGASLVWITGYIPESDRERFIKAAGEHGWAYLLTDVPETDDGVPTKIRYNKVTSLIRPVFDVLGTVPGYREYDISFWFLAFFALFFAMIIGDAGYGALFLVAAAIVHIRTKKLTNALLLLYLLPAATIVWGALTGTWFGLEGAMRIPFFRALVLPAFANYPEYFDVTATAAQNNVMKFCFSIGAIQLALACVMNIRRKLCGRDLSWLADLGWLIAICALYLLVLYLVVGESIPLAASAAAIGAGFLLVVLFGGMARGKPFGQGLKAGLGNTFTVFLNTISAFGNVMSYIRLIAVGMASLAIAQSFNDMAAGFSGALVVVGILIMIIGHALNIVMGFLSVVVHGVRLNLLEFSGQLGMEWAGIPYEPFRELKNEKNN